MANMKSVLIVLLGLVILMSFSSVAFADPFSCKGCKGKCICFPGVYHSCFCFDGVSTCDLASFLDGKCVLPDAGLLALLEQIKLPRGSN